MRQGGGGAWDPKFLRPFNDWELDAIQEFIGLTSNNKISSLEKDKLIWKGDESGCFTVKGCLINWKEAPPITFLIKCYGTLLSLQKLFFLPGRHGGTRF